MARHLEQMDYTVWQEDIAETGATRAVAGEGGFSLIAVLNVLDRCAAPRSLLAGAHTLLGPEPGWLLLATPLPFRGAYYGWRTGWSGRPVERFDLGGSDKAKPEDEVAWAAEALVLIEDMLPAAGFEPVVVSRVPYICAGDAFVPFFELDDLVVLARKF
mmetsp:Transcript_2666/g.6068  ORF Transcript_2666/g.6068 Transcript_2666/m.6068 type:complete len:159 (+) Transcript_2666:3-479(+)